MVSYEALPMYLALSGCIIASVFDLRGRKVPNYLVLMLLLASSIIACVRCLSDDSFIWTYLVGFFLGFGLGFMIWSTGAWSGGDAKMFWAISALIPGGFYALNVLFILAIILGVMLLFSKEKKKEGVVLMPYMTLALLASSYIDLLGHMMP